MREIAVILAYLFGYGLHTLGHAVLIDSILNKQRRVSRAVLTVSFFAFFIIRAYIYLFLPLNTTLNMLCTLILLFLLSLLYKASLLMRFLTVAFNYILPLVVDFAAAFALSAVFGISLEQINLRPGLQVAGILLSGLLAFALMWLAAGLFKKTSQNEYSLPKSYLAAIFLIPGLSILLYYTVSYHVMTRTPISPALAFIGGMILLAINVFVFFLYSKLLKEAETKYQNILLKQQSNIYAHELALENRSNQNIRRLRHDIKNHVTAAHELIRQGKIDELSAYLNRFSEEIKEPEQYSHTGCADLDGILNYKLREAVKAGVRIQSEIAVPEYIGVDAFDLTSIFANLLDNAIEGCAKCEDKRLLLNIRMDRGVLFLKIQNTFDGVVKTNANGKFATRKSEKAGHGIGLSNVERTLAKYGGCMSIDHVNNLFTVTAMLYPKDGKILQKGGEDHIQHSNL